MKKNIVAVLFLSVSLLASAQTEYDALRLSQTDINGTARYMSLGGAMGALGGDASAIKDNPAGLGVYRGSEISGTLNLALSNTQPIEWYSGKTTQDGSSKLTFNNVSYVMTMPVKEGRSLVGSNFSFSYQKINDYNKSFRINGNNSQRSFTDYLAAFSSPNPPIVGDVSYDNYDMPWLTVLGFDGYLIDIDGQNFTSVLGQGEQVTPSYLMNQFGSLSEFSFGWGGNYNDNLFIGASLNVRNLDYSLSSTLSENFGEGGGFDLVNKLSQSGVGVNAKLGAIYLPSNYLRLGVSVHSPSITYISEESYADMYSDLIPEEDQYPAETPVNAQSFNLWSPMQLQASVAYLFGKSGLISAEYNFVNYRGARFQTTTNSVQNFGDINLAMKDVLNNVHVFKVGAEVKATPNLSLRAGYAMMTPAVNQDYEFGKLLVRNSVKTNTEYFDQKYNTSFLTFGLGYREATWFIDLAYALRNQMEDFYPYQDIALMPALIDNKTHNIALTLGLRM